MKILSTLRAGHVVRQALYSPRDPNPNRKRRAIADCIDTTEGGDHFWLNQERKI